MAARKTECNMTGFRPYEEREIGTRRGFLRAAAGSLIGTTAFPALAQLRDSSPLKITRTEPYVLRIGVRPSYPCVRIDTQDGIHGRGKGTPPPSTPAVITQIRE